MQINKFIILTIIICFFTNGCASLTIRLMEPNHHRPGTLYPGTQQYISAFTEKRGSSNYDAYLLKDPGFLFFVAILIPFIAVDMLVTTPVYDTIALPWDTTRRLMRDDELENNFKENKAKLSQHKLNYSHPDYYRSEVTVYSRDSDIIMIEFEYWKMGKIQFIHDFYFKDKHLRLVIRKIRSIHDTYEDIYVCRLYFEDNQLIRTEACPEDFGLSEKELLNLSSTFFELAGQELSKSPEE